MPLLLVLLPLVVLVLVLAAFPLPLDGLLLRDPVLVLVLAYGDASPAARRGRPLLLVLVAAAAARFEAAVVRPVLLGVLVPAMSTHSKHRRLVDGRHFQPAPRKDRKNAGRARTRACRPRIHPFHSIEPHAVYINVVLISSDPT